MGHEPLVYGIWLTKAKQWLLDGNGLILSNDLLGIMKAQLKVHLNNGGTVGEVMAIGSDGEPVELSAGVKIVAWTELGPLGRVSNE